MVRIFQNKEIPGQPYNGEPSEVFNCRPSPHSFSWLNEGLKMELQESYDTAGTGVARWRHRMRVLTE